MADARRHRFDVVLVAAFDRVARSVRHFLEVLDELNHLGMEFVSFRENIDTGLGYAGHYRVRSRFPCVRLIGAGTGYLATARAGTRTGGLSLIRTGRLPEIAHSERVLLTCTEIG